MFFLNETGLGIYKTFRKRGWKPENLLLFFTSSIITDTGCVKHLNWALEFVARWLFLDQLWTLLKQVV